MITKVKLILRHWKNSIEKYNKIDEWNYQENLTILSNYVLQHKNSEQKDVLSHLRTLRDNLLNPHAKINYILLSIEYALVALDPPAICLFSKKGHRRQKKTGQEIRFKAATEQLFKEKLKFKKGMLLRNFDIETESAKDARKVRRIVEKRMSQAYHRQHKRNKGEEILETNFERYWMNRATSFQLYNIGQVENIKSFSRGLSTHWKKCYDPQTGEIVLKKKMAYSSEEEARQAIKSWQVKRPTDNRPMQAYKCVHCKNWHIGHKSTHPELLEDNNSIV